MNIILNNPLPISAVSKSDYDNKILYIFLAFMVFMAVLGLFFVNLTKISKNVPSSDQTITTQYSENV